MMCPLSITVQLFAVLVVLLLFCQYAVAQASKSWELNINVNSTRDIVLHMDQSTQFEYNLTGFHESSEDVTMKIVTGNEYVAIPEYQEILIKTDGKYAQGTFALIGNFLGRTEIDIYLNSERKESLKVAVVRDKTWLNTLFISSVATLVSILYINFGCAVNWGELRTSLKKPVGPIIGIVGQFVLMPLLSFGLARVLFPNNPEMQLGMFFTGVSPGGGASNIWTVILNGNIDMSITMTTVSTLLAFAMMPFWLFTLGRVIFEEGELPVPYREISSYAIALVIPLFIGYLIQRYLKKVSAFLVRILKMSSSALIIFIVVFAIVANLYLFKLFSWQIILAGMGLPWLAYVIAYFMARLLRQSHRNSITIALETGIQNTGIAIFLLKVTLPQPEADLTTIIPVSVAVMTPIPLSMILLVMKLKSRFWPKQEKVNLLNANTTAQQDDTSQPSDKNDDDRPTNNISSIS